MTRALLVLIGLVLASCAQLETPTFRGPGPFQGPPLHGAESQTPFQLNWPVKDIRITQKYSPPKNRRHQGIDFGGPRGTPIFAAHEGRVVYAGRGFRGYGKMVLIEFDNEWASLYAHLHKISVKEGQRIRLGQKIGQMGRTGRATGVHLHFELIRSKKTVDPLEFLPRSSQLVQNP